MAAKRRQRAVVNRIGQASATASLQAGVRSGACDLVSAGEGLIAGGEPT